MPPILVGSGETAPTHKKNQGSTTLPKNVPRKNSFRFLDKAQLLKLKYEIMRSATWLKALRRIERILFDLTKKVAGTVRNVFLVKNILPVTRKLERLLESTLVRTTREIGFSTVNKLSWFAGKWGNGNAWKWGTDASFAEYLKIMGLNGSSISSVITC